MPSDWNILVITNNLQQASFRLRIEALRPALESRGFHLDIRVRPRGLPARRKLLRSAGHYDAVILQRKLLDPSDAKLFRGSAKRIFFDVDDAVMYHNTPRGIVSRWRTWRRFKATAKRVDHVVAGNEYLSNLFREQGAPAASIVPTVVDPGHYRVKAHAATNMPRLVWIGSKSTLPYLRQALPTLGEAARHVPGLRLMIVADVSVERAPLPIDFVRWSVEAEADALCSADIGIAPTPEDRWTLGKCGFKIVQYMAAGLPVIASPVGANAELVRPGETGFLPEDPEEWVAAMGQLATDAALRSRMGEAARARVERLYSVDAAAEAWAKLLSGEPAAVAQASNA